MSDEITRISSSDLDRHESDTDWDRLEDMTDEDIEEAVEEDEEQEFLTPEWFQAATLVDPSADKKRITIRLDEDIVDFFKQQGSGYQSRINKVLRSYMLTQQMRDFAEQHDRILQIMSLLGQEGLSDAKGRLDLTRESVSKVLEKSSVPKDPGWTFPGGLSLSDLRDLAQERLAQKEEAENDEDEVTQSA